jgi:hypothetical protein
MEKHPGFREAKAWAMSTWRPDTGLLTVHGPGLPGRGYF